jgi:hypothetical protein
VEVAGHVMIEVKTVVGVIGDGSAMLVAGRDPLAILVHSGGAPLRRALAGS